LRGIARRYRIGVLANTKRTVEEIQAAIAENAVEQMRQAAELTKEAETLASELSRARNDEVTAQKLAEQRSWLATNQAEEERCRLVVEQLGWLISEADQEIAQLTQTGSALQERVTLGTAAVREAIGAGDATVAERNQSSVNDASQALANVPPMIAEKRRNRDDAEAQMEPAQYALTQAEAGVRNAQVEIVRLGNLPAGAAWTDPSTPPNTVLESHAPAPEYSPDVRARLATSQMIDNWAGGINRARADESRRLELSINPRLAQLIEKGGR
jgi:hypothetical protein